MIFVLQVDGLGYDKSFPHAVDRQKDGCVTSEKDQGSGSTCWAFAPVVGLECLNKLGYDVLEDLSTQDIIDHCEGSTNDGVHYAKDYPSKKVCYTPF